MPYKDRRIKLFRWRQNNRKRVHGNFRQTYIDNGGMCQAVLSDGAIHGTTKYLEYHAPLGERNGNGFGLRTLMCAFCHVYVDDEAHHGTENVYLSRLSEDISFEIDLCGGYQAWLAKFNLIDRYQPYTVKIKKERASDLNDDP